MGDIYIRLRGNAATGDREVMVEYESDPDMTQMEHEQRHREIVELLIKEGTITREETDEIIFQERQRKLAEDESAAEGQAG